MRQHDSKYFTLVNLLKRLKHFFSEGHVAYQVKSEWHYASKMFDLMHTPDLLGLRVNMSDIANCTDKFILIELSDLIGFGYDLSDIKDELRFWRNVIYILW